MKDLFQIVIIISAIGCFCLLVLAAIEDIMHPPVAVRFGKCYLRYEQKPTLYGQQIDDVMSFCKAKAGIEK